MVAFTTALWFIWNSRNKVRFDGVVVHATNVFGMIVGHIQASSCLVTGVMHNSILNLRVLKCFGASCNPRNAPTVFEVIWRPPPSGWVKVNTDGAWRRGLGVGGYGGVFRNDQRCFIGAFSSSLDIPSSVAAVVMAVIKAIELAWVRDWNYVWLEVDSQILLDLLCSPMLAPCTTKKNSFGFTS
ncbi:uncharacterized protein LOC112168480 [Rosa chinensis]|uniref:uncharacterized protein LOC112168480 n=1 Tax=Rosa chinensis TaxID=74649 RepID=UPI000D09578D|nr:uncharacterized protein LOC112168480 [Rosa chinensis]